MEDTLKNLGLSTNEIKVYNACLEMKSSKASQLTVKTKLGRHAIYYAIDLLVRKGMISEMVKSGIKFYSVVNPKLLYKKIEKEKLEKEKAIEEILVKYNELGMKKNLPKIVFFDMEGTLFKKVIEFSKGNTTPSAWTLIAEHLGSDALLEEEATKDKWNRGEYKGYVEWMEETIDFYKEYGLKKDFFDKVMDAVEYHKGVKEVFEELRKRGIRTALVSGGFKANADRAQKDLKIDHSFAACELFWDENGDILHTNYLPCDYEGKEHFLKLIMKEHGFGPEDCAFVGDGINDVFLASEVGIGISFNGHHKLEEVCDYVIRQKKGEEDFREVLTCLGIKKKKSGKS